MTKTCHHTIQANGIRQHYVESGSGAPVVLLHGFPFTSFTWRHQIPELAKKYRVIAPDLRGYGETDKPVTGYDKRNMAKDLRELMRKLDIEKVALIGHDRGARVATRFARDYPEATDRLVVMDNVPTRIIARDFNFARMAKTYWLFLFHLKLGRVLHNWDLATKKLLLRKAYQAIPKGGAAVVYDMLIDDERRTAAGGLLSSLNMLLWTNAGFGYGGSECADWMHEAGFSGTRVEPLVAGQSMVIGQK